MTRVGRSVWSIRRHRKIRRQSRTRRQSTARRTRTTRRHPSALPGVRATLVAALALLLLSACHRTPAPTPQPPPEPGPPASDLLIEENAWRGEAPPDAETVSPEEFRKLLEDGEIELISTADLERQQADLERQFEEDVALLEALPDPGPAVEALLAQAAELTGPDPDHLVTTPGGPAMLLSIASQLRIAVQAHETAQDVENALLDYRQTYALLPPDLQAEAPEPDSLAGADLAEVREALGRLDELLGGSSTLDLDNVRPEAAPLAPGGYSPSAAVSPGQGRDQDAACAAPTGYVSSKWFPLKNFVSPVKNQANRGTCWAFTAIGALESRERVQNGSSVDLSEQFLVNKVKEDWDESDFTDGYWADRALNTAADEGQVLPPESGWTYNPATNRANPGGNDSAAYAGTCNPYGQGANAGTCSDTAHQSRRVCTTVVFTFCGYATVTYSGPGVSASRAYQVWASGQRFDLNRYRLLLSQGYALMASFPVYEGFMNGSRAVGGVVSDYATTMVDAAGNEVNGSYGGHAVLIVGFLSNEELSTPIREVNAGGGGYFIVKNSWGCGAGDGGYYYVPADYVSGLFNSLSALAFDTRRSDAWNREQETPGGSEEIGITIRANPARVDLRVEHDLAEFFRVTHPVAGSVSLTVADPGVGTVYDGQWSTARDVLVPPSLRHTFTTAGRHALALTARYGGTERRATLNVDVVNSPPVLAVNAAGSPSQGEPYPITAAVRDINESDTTGLCARTTWAVDAPDTLSATTGCRVTATFGATGSRSVRIATADTEGLTASTEYVVDVQPPPENPYPRVTSAGVYSRDIRRIEGQIIGCFDVAVTNGATIDFDAKGCTLNVGARPPRYSAKLEVENPDGEALTYAWTVLVVNGAKEEALYGTIRTTEPTFVPTSPGNTAPTVADCRIAVTVNAPDPARNKSLTVWNGKCAYLSTSVK